MFSIYAYCHTPFKQKSANLFSLEKRQMANLQNGAYWLKANTNLNAKQSLD